MLRYHFSVRYDTDKIYIAISTSIFSKQVRSNVGIKIYTLMHAAINVNHSTLLSTFYLPVLF